MFSRHFPYADMSVVDTVTKLMAGAMQDEENS
jgi:hypothetical protein